MIEAAVGDVAMMVSPALNALGGLLGGWLGGGRPGST